MTDNLHLDKIRKKRVRFSKLAMRISNGAFGVALIMLGATSFYAFCRGLYKIIIYNKGWSRTLLSFVIFVVICLFLYFAGKETADKNGKVSYE